MSEGLVQCVGCQKWFTAAQLSTHLWNRWDKSPRCHRIAVQPTLKRAWEEYGGDSNGNPRFLASYRRTCRVCGQVFFTSHPSALDCWERACQITSNRKAAKVRSARPRAKACECCGQWFTARRSDGKFCSNACRQKTHRKSAALQIKHSEEISGIG
jgi:hypothetical protein